MAIDVARLWDSLADDANAPGFFYADKVRILKGPRVGYVGFVERVDATGLRVYVRVVRKDLIEHNWEFASALELQRM